MATAKVVLFKSKLLKNGLHPIMLRITKDRKPKYISLGYNCSPELWDDSLGMPKKKHPNYLELKLLIEKKVREIETLTLEYDNENKEYSSEEIKNQITAEKKKTDYNVFDYFDIVIEKLVNTNRVGYANVFKSSKTSLKTFVKSNDLKFNQITPKFLCEYENDFLSRNVTLNAISVYFRNLRTFFNMAKIDEVVKKDFNPLRDFNFSKFGKIKTKKRAIKKEEIQKIANLEVKGISILNAKNYFLFSYYCRGINFIDIAKLKWENIEEDRLNYIRSKTKDRFSIGLLQPAKDILEYYKKITFVNKQSYIFPILNDFHNTPKRVDNRIHKIIAITNVKLKEIGKLVGITIPLTTYVARHSYATVMKLSGISTSIISESLGHETEKVTQIYLGDFENDTLDKANESIL